MIMRMHITVCMTLTLIVHLYSYITDSAIDYEIIYPNSQRNKKLNAQLGYRITYLVSLPTV